MERSRWHTLGLTALCLSGYFLSGSAAILFPTILPSIMRGFHLNTAQVGIVFPANAVGSLIGGLMVGLWSDRVGHRLFICGSAVCLAAGLLLSAFATQWSLFVIGFLVIGIAQGPFSPAINALLLDLHPLRRARTLNLLHGVYSLGATLSPLLVGWVLSATGWRVALEAEAGIWLLLGIVGLGFHYPSVAVPAKAKQFFHWNMPERGLFVRLFAVAFLYNGVAWALLGWIKVFMKQSSVHSGVLVNGNYMISLFYLGLAGGRFSCAGLSERWGYGKTLLICGVGSTLAYPLVAFGSQPGWIAVGMFLSGLFLAGLYPTAIAYGTRLLPALTGMVAGTMSIAMTLGSMLPPWWTGVAAGAWGLHATFVFNFILVVPLIPIALYLRRVEHYEPVEAVAAG
jgi:MFS family permease